MTEKSSKTTDFHVIGAGALKVNKGVYQKIGKVVADQLSKSGAGARIRSMRFLPSTRIDLGDGSFQFVANNIVEVPAGLGATRTQAIDSVITVGRDKRQILERVTIPALAREPAAG